MFGSKRCSWRSGTRLAARRFLAGAGCDAHRGVGTSHDCRTRWSKRRRGPRRPNLTEPRTGATRTRDATRLAAMAGLAVVAVLITAACNSGLRDGAAPDSSTSGASTSAPTSFLSTTSTARASTASSSTTTSVTSTTTTASSPPSGATPSCVGSQLAVSSGPNLVATGHIDVVIVFTNTASEPCQLTGYPGVAALDAAGTQRAQADRTLNGFLGGVPTGPPPLVTLARDQSASAIVEGSDQPTGDGAACPSYPSLLVTPPNTTQSVTVAVGLPGCEPLQVHPVVPGTTGNLPA
jgi:hypothetical protein